MDLSVLLAQADVLDGATTVVEKVGEAVSQGGESWWKSIGLVLLGALGFKGIMWVSAWLDGKGKLWIDERLAQLQEKVNQSGIMGQIQADDAVFKIMRDTIPEVLGELAETAKKDLIDGKLDKANWDDIGSRLWQRTQPHVTGGANDYLAQSSFNDGKAVAIWVAKKFFAKKKAKEEGLTDE